MLTSVTVERFGDHWWTEICKKVKHSLVFIDDASAETLHWHGGLARLQKDGGVAGVKELSSFESGSDKQRKATFIVSGPVVGLKADIVQEIVRNSKFDFCQVVTNASPAVHNLAAYPGGDVADNRTFLELEEQLLEWMGNHNYTCEILFFPYVTASVASPELFVTPAFNDSFASLALTLAGDSSSSSTAAAMANLTHEQRIDVLHLVTSLHALFHTMNLGEDVFTVGPLSRLLGEQLESFGPARARRKTAANRTSLLLVDRTLDLAGTTLCHFDSLLDKIRAALPRFPGHANDVHVDVGPALFGRQPGEMEQGSFCGGCLAPSSSSAGKVSKDLVDEKSLLSRFVCDEEEALIKYMQRQLSTKKGSKANKIKLDDVIATYQGDLEAIRKKVDLLQRALAASIASQSDDLKTCDKMYKFQRKCLRSLHDDADNARGLLGRLVPLVQGRNDHQYSLDDLLVLIVFAYGILPPTESFCADDEDRLKAVLSDAIVQEVHREDGLTGLLHDLTSDEARVDETLADALVETLFSRLRAVPRAKKQLKRYHDSQRVDPDDGSIFYAPLLDRLIDDIYADDRHDVPDLNHVSGGLGGMLKSGISMFGMSVNKRHPRENPMLFVFVVGGITAREAGTIKASIGRRSQTEVVVGGTRLLAPKDTLRWLFGDVKATTGTDESVDEDEGSF